MAQEKKKQQDVPDAADLMVGLMSSVLAFMAHVGMSDAEIGDIYSKCRKRRTHGDGAMTARRNGIEYECDTVAGAVLRAWHKTPRYIDGAARPIRMRMDGSGATLTTLIRSQMKRADVDAVVRSMLKAGLLRKDRSGFYSPTRESATIGTSDPLAIDHIAKTVMRLVETATRNIATTRNKLPLIERYAHVPDLSRAQAKAFASFSRQQGQACLDAIEDWLEARQVGKLAKKAEMKRGVSAGMHIFAYLGSSGSPTKKVVHKVSGLRVTSPREARA